MAQVNVRAILIGLALWGAVMIFVSYIYTYNNVLIHGLAAPKNEPDSLDSEWGVVAGLTIMDIEQLRKHGLNLRGVKCTYCKFLVFLSCVNLTFLSTPNSKHTQSFHVRRSIHWNGVSFIRRSCISFSF